MNVQLRCCLRGRPTGSSNIRTTTAAAAAAAAAVVVDWEGSQERRDELDFLRQPILPGQKARVAGYEGESKVILLITSVSVKATFCGRCWGIENFKRANMTNHPRTACVVLSHRSS